MYEWMVDDNLERVWSNSRALFGILFVDFCGGTDGSQGKPLPRFCVLPEVRTRLHPCTSPTSYIAGFLTAISEPCFPVLYFTVLRPLLILTYCESFYMNLHVFCSYNFSTVIHCLCCVLTFIMHTFQIW
jgi:hypothetical protein